MKRFLFFAVALLVIYCSLAFAGRRRERIELNQLPNCRLAFGFNEGNRAKDWSPEANDGTVSGATWNGTNGISGFDGGFFLDGNDEIALTGADPFDFGAGPFSISVWFRTPAGGTDVRFIMVLREAGGDHLEIYINHPAAGNVGCHINPGDARRTGAAIDIRDDTWHHVSVTVANGGGAYVLYLDGGIADSGTYSGTLDNMNASYIGSTGGAVYWLGGIDEVTVYNRVLSAAEVKFLYTIGKAKTP